MTFSQPLGNQADRHDQNRQGGKSDQIDQTDYLTCQETRITRVTGPTKRSQPPPKRSQFFQNFQMGCMDHFQSIFQFQIHVADFVGVFI